MLCLSTSQYIIFSVLNRLTHLGILKNVRGIESMGLLNESDHEISMYSCLELWYSIRKGQSYAIKRVVAELAPADVCLDS